MEGEDSFEAIVAKAVYEVHRNQLLCLSGLKLLLALARFIAALEALRHPKSQYLSEPGSPPPAAPPPHPSVMKMRAIMLIANDCLMWTPLLMLGSSPDTLRPERAQPSIFLGETLQGDVRKSLG